LPPLPKGGKIPFLAKSSLSLPLFGKEGLGEILSAYAEDHGLWPWMNAKRITLRSLVRRRVCFGGFRRRAWRYHGLCPWGSINHKQFHIPSVTPPIFSKICLSGRVP
jgi:hypothetical protein